MQKKKAPHQQDAGSFVLNTDAGLLDEENIDPGIQESKKEKEFEEVFKTCTDTQAQVRKNIQAINNKNEFENCDAMSKVLAELKKVPPACNPVLSQSARTPAQEVNQSKVRRSLKEQSKSQAAFEDLKEITCISKAPQISKPVPRSNSETVQPPRKKNSGTEIFL